MKTLNRLCATTLLLFLLAIPGLAGESSMPGAPAPPPTEPPPPAETTTSAADSSEPSVTATALEILGSLLEVIL